MPEPGHPEPGRVETTILMHYTNPQGELHTMRIHCSEDPGVAPWLQPEEVCETARLIAARAGAECEILSLQLKERIFTPLQGRPASNSPTHGSARIYDFKAQAAGKGRASAAGLAAKACLALGLAVQGASEAIAACCVYGLGP